MHPRVPEEPTAIVNIVAAFFLHNGDGMDKSFFFGWGEIIPLLSDPEGFSGFRTLQACPRLGRGRLIRGLSHTQHKADSKHGVESLHFTFLPSIS